MYSIAILGVGAVGSAIAQSIISKDIASELILFDKDEQRCLGEVKDLSDALIFSRTSKIIQGTYDDVRRAHIVVIAAGRRQKPGETRHDLIEHNKHVLDDILGNLSGLRSDALVIIVSNPLDTLTYCALQQLEIPRRQIFGSGTYLDTLRLTRILSNSVGIAQSSISTVVLGEHGDSQVIAWSATRIADQPAESYGIIGVRKREITEQVRNAAYSIIQDKGATYYGIAASVAQLCEHILFNSGAIIPVSWYHEAYGACMSLPAQITRTGIERIFPLSLSKREQDLLDRSAEILRGYQLQVRD